MSGIYADNVVPMPIIWDGEDGKPRHGLVYACEGESPSGFIFLVITKEDTIVQVSVREDNVRLDKRMIEKAGEAKKAASGIAFSPPRSESQILPPNGGQI